MPWICPVNPASLSWSSSKEQEIYWAGWNEMGALLELGCFMPCDGELSVCLEQLWDQLGVEEATERSVKG